MRGKTIGELKIGDSAKFSKTVTESDIYLYAGVTGDFNPAHLNEEYAKKTFFKTRIAQGMLTAGFVSGLLGAGLPGPGTVYIRQELDFLAPVHIGDTITARVEIVEVVDNNNRVRVRTTCINQDGARVLERFGPVSMKENRISLATFPGGEGVITTDLSEDEGLRLAEVEDKTVDKLRPVFPPWDIPPNPWDLGLTTQFNNPNVVYRVVIDAMLDDPNVDALAIQLHPVVFLFPEEILKVFGNSAAGRKPIALWLAGMEAGRHKVLQSLEERRILVFPSPEKAIRALSALCHFSDPGRYPDLSD